MHLILNRNDNSSVLLVKNSTKCLFGIVIRVKNVREGTFSNHECCIAQSIVLYVNSNIKSLFTRNT